MKLLNLHVNQKFRGLQEGFKIEFRKPEDSETNFHEPICLVENWIFLRTIMPWRIALWGIRNEIRAYKISRQTKSLLTLRTKKNIVTYRNLKEREEERFKKSIQQYFFE